MVEKSENILALPEVQKAIREAASEAARLAVAEMTKAQSPDGALLAFAQTMAAQIGEVADQGTNRKRVAPEILAQRARAAERCEALLQEAREQGLKPEYRVIATVYFVDRIIQPWRRLADKTVVPQEIVWTGPPNEALRPTNAVAEKIFEAYRESIGSTEKIKAIRHANGGIVAPDNRPHWITPGGLVVKGDGPAHFAVEPRPELGFRDNNDPNAPEIHVLGTIAAPAKRNGDQTLGAR